MISSELNIEMLTKHLRQKGAAKEMAEDAVMIAVQRVSRRLDDHPLTHDTPAVRYAYLRRAAENALRDLIRAEGTQQRIKDDLKQMPWRLRRTAHTPYLLNPVEAARVVSETLTEIRPAGDAMLATHVLLGLATVDTLAEQLGVSRRRVAIRLTNGLPYLRKAIDRVSSDDQPADQFWAAIMRLSEIDAADRSRLLGIEHPEAIQ